MRQGGLYWKRQFSDEFKRVAVRQITERGYPVSEVSQRLGVSAHSLYARRKRYAPDVGKGDEQSQEVRELKRELAQVTEERDILKKRPRTSPRMQSEVRVRCQASPSFLGAHHVPAPFDPSQRLLCVAQEPLDDARAKMEKRLRDYNEFRPHSDIGNKPPISLMNVSGACGPP